VNELLNTTHIEAAKLQFKSVIVMVWIQECDGGKWLCRRRGHWLVWKI